MLFLLLLYPCNNKHRLENSYNTFKQISQYLKNVFIFREMIKGTVLTWSSRQFICSKDIVPSILYQKFLIYPAFLKITNFLPFKLHSQTYGVFLHSLLTVKCLRKFYECKHSQAINQNQINGSVWFGMTGQTTVDSFCFSRSLRDRQLHIIFYFVHT